MKNNFQKTALFLSLAIFLLLCFVFIILYRQININNQNAEASTTKWQTEAQRRNDIISLNSSLKQVSNDRALLDTHFAQSSDIVPFLNTISGLAPSVGATSEIDSVTTGGANSNTLVVEIKASGTFEQVYKFLTLLENSPYELDFTSVDINKSTDPSSVSTKKTNNSDWQGDFKVQLLSFTP